MKVLFLIGLAVCAGVCAVRAEAPKVEFIAHRGESFDAPENTMAAFRLAWERKVSAIELDVHLTTDGKLIVCHDANTERTTGVNKVIRNSSLEELRTLDAGKWKGARWAGEKLPTLEEALTTIPEGTRCFIEIKVGPEAVPAVAAAVQASGKKPEQLVIISFHAEVIAASKRQMPNLKAYYLSSLPKDPVSRTLKAKVQELIERAKSIHADGLNLNFGQANDPELVQQVKAAALEVYAWTVDDPSTARRLMAAGIDGITSNRAAWLRSETTK